jgi:CheY-like chemotaxis protein
MTMRRVRLIHWNAEEANERAAILREAGYEVVSDVPSGPELLRGLRNAPPDVVVIDLGRLPSQGRDVGLGVRTFRATRHVPLVFVGGELAKIARVKSVLPDATFTSWGRIRSALKRAIEHPPANPVKPDSMLAGYSGTPLPKKLGIKENSVVALVSAPEGFAQTLGELPAGTKLVGPGRRGRCDIVLWFLRSRRGLERGMKAMAARTGPRRLWILWPKKASGLQTDLAEAVVREAGLAAGLVDFKICAVDATWSGLAFTTRHARK